MKTKTLHIQNPCNQNWDEMSLLGNGRYCGSCNHVIHDFSDMSNNELLQMLQSGQHSCGRFDKKQMGLMYVLGQKKRETKKYWNSVAAAIIAGMLQVSVGYSQTPSNHQPLLPRNFLFKGDVQTTTSNQETDQTTTKQKFSFRVVDSETKKPLPSVHIEIMGLSGYTDSLGRIDFSLEYDPEVRTRVFLNLLAAKYEDQKAETTLQACINKLTILYMRKKKTHENREYVVGFF